MTQKVKEQPLNHRDDPIPDKNLFMMCPSLNTQALSKLPTSYHIRPCRKDEVTVWQTIHFDHPEVALAQQPYMSEFFKRVYAPQGGLFYETCLFVCDQQDQPIATAFIWKVYDEFNTVHWLKVRQEYEGQGIGRALLSIIMQDLLPQDYPVYLHTQPSSYRAIKLYSDFGFYLLSDPVIGHRSNDLAVCLPILEKYMTPEGFANLQVTKAPAHFVKKMAQEKASQF